MRRKQKGFWLIFLILFVITGCTPKAGGANSIQDSPPNQITNNTAIESQEVILNNRNPENLILYFIDAGQADACLIEQNNHFILIDAGDNTSEGQMVDFLKSKGVQKLDYVFGTHPHADHIGGLDAVIDAFPIEEIYLPKVMANTKTFEDVLDALERKGLQVNTPIPGSKLPFEATEIEVLGPTQEYGDLNNNSIVLRFTFLNSTFLFTGDMEQEAENDILSAGYDVKADLIKIGHHGSNTSTSQAFLDAVSPSYAVISVGADNSYGHPDEAIIRRLEDKNVEDYRTDQSGTIEVISDGNELSFIYGKEDTANDVGQEKGNIQNTGQYYVGNQNSKKFHLPACRTLPAEKNRVDFDTREAALEAGFVPCKNCNP